MNKILIFISILLALECKAQKIYFATDTLLLEIGLGRELDHEKGKNGEWKYYYNNDTTKIKFKATFKDNVLNGQLNAYWPNGKLKATIGFVNGEKDGECRYYGENGKLIYIINYRNNRLNGLVIKYYNNGKIKQKLNFQDGVYSGKNYAYNNNSKNTILAEGEYDNGNRSGKYIYYIGKNRLIIETFNNNLPSENRKTYQNNVLVREDILDLSTYLFKEIVLYENGIKSSTEIIVSDSYLAKKFHYGDWLGLPNNFHTGR